MRWLLDPRAFNVLIIVLFLAAAVRWGFARNWPQTFYWIFAAGLNVAVTYMGSK